MPLNTRVGRCVTKLRNKYGYGKAIGICQHSTKQNYLTGKTTRNKKTRRRKKTKRGGMKRNVSHGSKHKTRKKRHKKSRRHRRK